MDSGIQCILSNLLTTPSCVVELACLREGIPSRETWTGFRGGRWAHANLVKYKKAKSKVLCMGEGNPEQKHRLGRERIGNSPEEKDLGGFQYLKWAYR